MRRKLLMGIAVLAAVLTACGGPDDSGDDVQAPTTPTETGVDAGDSSPTDAAEAEFVWEDGVLQPLEDGFPDRRLTLLNVDDPGSSDGLYARSMQRALEALSPVPVETLDRPSPAFGTWSGLEFMQNQAGGDEGYINQVAAFTGAGLDFLVEPITPELGYTLDDMNPVIATERVPFVVIAPADSPWETWEDLAAAGKEADGELRYIALGVGSQLDIAMERLMAEGGWSANKIPLGDPVEITTTVAAGEGDFAMMLPDVALGQWEAGRIKVLLIIGDEAPAPWDDVTTTADLGLDEPWGSLRGFMVTPDTPDEHRAWLFELFSEAAKAAEYQERLEKIPGATGVIMGHDEVVDVTKNALELGEPIVRDLGLHYEENQ